MRVIHVLRKPCSESTVAANVLRYGTGALNIDATRINTKDDLNGGAYAEAGSDRWDGAENWRYKRQGGAGEYQQPVGRWPANLVLQHLGGCRQPNTVEDCENGCPVAELNQQSGMSVSVVRKPTGNPLFSHTGGTSVVWNSNSVLDSVERGFEDAGGASRFFKQVKA